MCSELSLSSFSLAQQHPSSGGTTLMTMVGRCPSTLLLALVMVMVMAMQPAHSVPVIHAPWGALQGISMEGDEGRMMNAYLGIPYAMPPVGELRYEKPLPHPGPAKGQVFQAQQVMPACPQGSMMIGSRPTSEDCLMLDVYTPADGDTESAGTAATPMAVMVFIHGGGLLMGGAYFYRPSKLVVDGRVMVVVIQYRLGVLGFLSSGDGMLPANLGLWDQNLALHWVKDNAEAFGGDPERITIFGESAGSWSVGLHLVIPQSRGLFRRAILQSGAFAHLSRYADVLDFKAAFKGFADLFDCEGGDSRQLVQCLKQQPVDLLLDKAWEYAMTSPLYNFYYPVVDGELIPREPHELLQDGSAKAVDIIQGFNNQEGSIVLGYMMFENLTEEQLLTADFFQGQLDMCFLLTGMSNNPVLKKTTEFFYRRAEFGSDVWTSMGPVVELSGDCQMMVPTVEWSQFLAAGPRSAAHYMYVIDHDFAFNSQGPVPGTHHGDDELLLFDLDQEFPEDSFFLMANKTTLTEEEQTLSRQLVALWTAFAKTGDPNPPSKDALGGGSWPQFTADREEYLSLSPSPRVVPHLGPYRDRVALWLQLLPELATLTSRPDTPGEDAAGEQGPRDEL
ncbi:acylcarnitine hydrolase-like [Babylonia areolata]|uniref:acylcarnitine hydrolase-like n=1 Tax=Babylonia areolata TaxID=304850 RepID=UPI003FD2078C